MHVVLTNAHGYRYLFPLIGEGLRAREIQRSQSEDKLCEVFQPGQDVAWIRVRESFDEIVFPLVAKGLCLDGEVKPAGNMHRHYASELCKALKALVTVVDGDTGQALFAAEISHAKDVVRGYEKAIVRNARAPLNPASPWGRP